MQRKGPARNRKTDREINSGLEFKECRLLTSLSRNPAFDFMFGSGENSYSLSKQMYRSVLVQVYNLSMYRQLENHPVVTLAQIILEIELRCEIFSWLRPEEMEEQPIYELSNDDWYETHHAIYGMACI